MSSSGTRGIDRTRSGGHTDRPGVDTAVVPGVGIAETGPTLRAKQATYALLDGQEEFGSGPLATAEVCEYDKDAPSVESTAAALKRAQVSGLVRSSGQRPTLWYPTAAARDMFDIYSDSYDSIAAPDASLDPVSLATDRSHSGAGDDAGTAEVKSTEAPCLCGRGFINGEPPVPSPTETGGK